MKSWKNSQKSEKNVESFFSKAAKKSTQRNIYDETFLRK